MESVSPCEVQQESLSSTLLDGLVSLTAEILQKGKHLPLQLHQLSFIDQPTLVFACSAVYLFPSWFHKVPFRSEERHTKAPKSSTHFSHHLHLCPVDFHVESLEFFC